MGDRVPFRRPRAVIFDLDGLLVDTESLCREVAQQICEEHGRTLTPEVHAQCVGLRPVESWRSLAERLQIPMTGEVLYEQTEATLYDRFTEAKTLPGSARLVHHLKAAGIPLGLATSSSRRGAERKLAGRGLLEAFDAVVCGDDVPQSKPSPDVYLACAEALGVDPRDALAFEDAPSGVTAATAAGMRVVVVPSVRQRDSYPEADATADIGAVLTLTSLLDFLPEDFGLPRFDDLVCGTVPLLPPWELRGTVVKGFGRGSKVLGIPTANLDPAALKGTEVGDAVCGIYYGVASVGTSEDVHVTALSIGWNPVFENESKTVEPWILHDFGRDFYGEELRLLVCGYIRPESHFPSLDALIARIHEDGEVAKRAMGDQSMAKCWANPTLRPKT